MLRFKFQNSKRRHFVNTISHSNTDSIDCFWMGDRLEVLEVLGGSSSTDVAKSQSIRSPPEMERALVVKHSCPSHVACHLRVQQSISGEKGFYFY